MIRAPEFINDPMAYFDRGARAWKTREGATEELKRKVTERNEQDRIRAEYCRKRGVLA